jgi:molybdate transport system regulatory protein
MSMGVPKAEQLSLKSKMWLEIQGRPIMGEGRMAMLEAIDTHRSILQASRQTGISYRRMRGAIRDMETAFDQVLVVTRRGGRLGGYAELTPAAIALLEAFRTLTQGFHDATDIRFKRIFGFL